MFNALLIANRGEIACRVIRTARRMGLRTIAVYSDADADALHVSMADESRRIGTAPAADSYLSIGNILDVARDSGADAIHPGYGFLAENAEFAAACAAAGVIFVGPSPESLRAMGEKTEAKRMAEAAGVPVLPDYQGTARRRDALRRAAAKVGYPLLVKAAAGGGGRGMRLVENADGFDDALDAARREALAAFGDDRVFFERYLPQARHVEVQVFGDMAGHVVHLFERDCSAQRRHQKLIEEAPAPGLSSDMRRALGEAAVAAAEAVGYVGAGTVEFLVDAAPDSDGAFYFLEMNTRLQVEHPVTEMITGLDLVEWQLRIAAGEDLPRDQAAIGMHGHAVEARLYAEDPARGFLPTSGRLERLRFPEHGATLRIETGVREGDSVSTHYDTLLAKLVAHGPSRAQAIQGLRRALAGSIVAGPPTNRAFLGSILRHERFAKGAIDTAFVEREEESLFEDAAVPRERALALAAFAESETLRSTRDVPQREDADRHSPWGRRDSWRLFGHAESVFRFRCGSTSHLIAIDANGDVTVDGGAHCLSVRGDYRPDGEFAVTIDGVAVKGRILRFGDVRQITVGERCRALRMADAAASASAIAAGAGVLTAPLPASIVAVHVRPGQRVMRGAALLVLEAMKMEHVIAAPDDGTVAAVHYTVGAQVEEGAQLIEFETTQGRSG